MQYWNLIGIIVIASQKLLADIPPTDDNSMVKENGGLSTQQDQPVAANFTQLLQDRLHDSVQSLISWEPKTNTTSVHTGIFDVEEVLNKSTKKTEKQRKTNRKRKKSKKSNKNKKKQRIKNKEDVEKQEKSGNRDGEQVAKKDRKHRKKQNRKKKRKERERQKQKQRISQEILVNYVAFDSDLPRLVENETIEFIPKENSDHHFDKHNEIQPLPDWLPSWIDKKNSHLITYKIDNHSDFSGFDSSCQSFSKLLEAPTIPHGSIRKYITRRNPDPPFNSYQEAYYICDMGFHLVSAVNRRLYCREMKWIGEIPECIHDEPFEINLPGEDCTNDEEGCEQICRVVDGATRCMCLRGYEVADDWRSCQDIDECLQDNGGCEGSCINKLGSYSCLCPAGYYVAPDGKSCYDKNECSVRNGHGPCQDTCINTEGGYLCTCDGISGTQLAADNHTCVDLDECQINNFGCSHRCLNTFGTAFCLCDEGFVLGDNWKTCQDINECETGLIDCQFGCINTVGSYHCLDQSEVLQCNNGFYLSEGKCQDVDECEEDNGGCETLCLNTIGSYECSCDEGFHISHDGKKCKDEDECLLEIHRCSDFCHNTVGSYRCSCPEGYYLFTDNRTCHDVNECEYNNGNCSDICVNIPGSFKCHCPHRYVLDTNGYTCHEEDKCQVNNGGCSHTCVNSGHGHRCLCPDGFTLRNDNASCTDIDECLYPDICGPNEQCRNVVGSYLCVFICGNGYIRRGDQDCTDIDECSVDNFGCSHICHNTEGSAHCQCPKGYRLDSDHKTCKDIDECQEIHPCEGKCVNTLGSYSCLPKCSPGYRMKRDTCIDVDECLTNNGGCDQICVNTVGSYLCACLDGFSMSERNASQCKDIDECQFNNGGCSHDCVNTRGSYLCICSDFFVLDADKKTCLRKHQSCSPPIPPPNGEYHCSETDQLEQFSIGTWCEVRCKAGYTLSNHSYLRCHGDGTWQGTQVHCISDMCDPLPSPKYGGVMPSSCSLAPVSANQQCYFTCHTGYRVVGNPVRICHGNSKWLPKSPLPYCEKVQFEPEINCPPNQKLTLQPHQQTAHVKITPPKANVDDRFIEVYPGWARSMEVDLPSGKTRITYEARSPIDNTTATCSFELNVQDKEAPIVHNCPTSIRTVLPQGKDSVRVDWTEPVFEDNVQVYKLWASNSPGNMFEEGQHKVLYVATDRAGNKAKCSFHILVKRLHCGKLKGLQNGIMRCMRLKAKKLCRVSCQAGYYIHNKFSSKFYVCGLDKTWTPSSTLPPCSPYYKPVKEECMPGYEYVGGEKQICVSCPPGMYQPSGQHGCQKCPTGTYQEDFSQTECQPCPKGKTTTTEGQKSRDSCVPEEIVYEFLI